MSMTLKEREIAAGLRPEVHPNPYKEIDAKTLELRIKWVNNLRVVVGRRMPKNNLGHTLVSDLDLLLADVEEREEALELTMRKKKKLKP